jgi:carboxylate-amine ligase
MSITAHSRPQAIRQAGDAALLTVGVEEEFLLLDPVTGENLPVGEQVIAALPDDIRGQSRLEFRRSMIEMVTPVCTDLAQLDGQLRRLRNVAGAASTEVGARMVAIGATPVGDQHRTVPANSRYQAMARRYGAIAQDTAVCGCHVHVGVPDRETAVQVCTRLRVWLPVIQAMTANSPLHEGVDTGHASWRSIQLERWPSLGPTPHFDCAGDYDDAVAQLIAAGVMLDETMIYWYARPSARYPTVEVRVGDVCPTVEDTVLVAALIRALVATVVDEVRAGIPAPQVPECLVSAAHWRAAHDGLDGELVDLRLGTTRPAWQLLDEMFATVSPALLRHGDLDLVVSELARLRRRGNGATRQRRIHHASGSIHTVLTRLAEQTTGR